MCRNIHATINNRNELEILALDRYWTHETQLIFPVSV